VKNLTAAIITDCADDNARARQELRFSSLFGVQPTFLGVGKNAPDIEAAGNLIDQLDATTNLPVSRTEQDIQAVILVNVAPRGDAVKKKWDNGTPFCYFRIGNTLVASTYAGRSLGLAKARGLINEVELLDIPTVVKAAVAWGEITEEQARHISHTQFRSLEFLPLVAYWLSIGKPVPSETVPIDPWDNTSGAVWCIDSFGNAKTTLRASDIDFTEGKTVLLADGKPAICRRRLADVPKDTTALVVGSSGLNRDRFLEVVVQWRDDGFSKSDSATSRHNLIVGSQVLASS
jgi:hypothetical protein